MGGSVVRRIDELLEYHICSVLGIDIQDIIHQQFRIQHTANQLDKGWTNVLNVAEEYEKYVEKNDVTNGIITQDTAYLRVLF